MRKLAIVISSTLIASVLVGLGATPAVARHARCTIFGTPGPRPAAGDVTP